VMALAELRPRLRELVGAKYAIPRRVESHLELAAADDIDAVVAIAPEDLNERIVCDLLKAGKPVMTEKPMAPSVEAAQRMVAAGRETETHLMVGYMKRYDDGVREARRLIEQWRESGALGQMTFARAHCFGGDWQTGLKGHITTDEEYPLLERTPLPAWLPEEASGAYRRLNNVYCHNVNLLRFLLGSSLEVKHVDMSGPSWIVLLDGGGFPVSLEAGQLAAHAWEEHTRIYFERGWIEIETPPPLLRNVPARVIVYGGGDQPEVRQPIAPWTWAFENEARHFLECVREGKEPLSSGEDSLRDVELIEEIARQGLT
jgi:predicted dehydrogenase